MSQPLPNRRSRRFMRTIRKSLSVKLSLAVALIFTGAVLTFTYYLVFLQEKQAFEHMVLNASQFSSTVKRSAHYSMLLNQRDSLHKIML